MPLWQPSRLKVYRDILEIANERRYSQYDINLVKPDLIVPRSSAFTIGGRMDARGRELEPLEEASLARLVEELTASGAEAVAICLMHAYANPAHELRLRDLLQARMPDLVISLSHEVSPEARVRPAFDHHRQRLYPAANGQLSGGFSGPLQR